MSEYSNFFSLHKPQKNLFDFFNLMFYFWRSPVQSLTLGKTVAFRKNTVIEKNLIVDNVRNVILMSSFCSTGDLKKNQPNKKQKPYQGVSLKQVLVVCLQKLEF